MAATWSPDSWRSKPILQVPSTRTRRCWRTWSAICAISRRWCSSRRCGPSRRSLPAWPRGEGFLLQGGDCAESFKEHKTDYIRDYFQLFLQMALILTFAGNSQVVKVGRVAGQFAKPRSSPIEKQGGKELPSYRGDIINGAGVHGRSAHSRSAPPARGLPAVGRDLEFPARAARRRLCLARECASLGAEVHGGTSRSRPATKSSPTRSSARWRSTRCSA